MRKLRGAGNTLLTNGTISKFPVLVHFGVCAEAALANEAVRSKPRKATGIRLSLILLLHIFSHSPQSQAHSIKYDLSGSYAVQLIDAGKNDLLPKFTIHHECIDVAQRWVEERLRKCADNLKFKTLPQPYGAGIGADHEIELHRAKSATAGAAQRMLTHRACHAAAGCGEACHVAAICNMPTATLLIGLQKIRADNFAVLIRDEDLVFSRKPVSKRACFVHVAREGISLAGADDGLHDGPDGVLVSVGRGANQHSRSLPRLLLNAGGLPD